MQVAVELASDCEWVLTHAAGLIGISVAIFTIQTQLTTVIMNI